LKQHQETHLTTKKFHCDLCGYRTNSKSSLKRHILRFLNRKKRKPQSKCKILKKIKFRE
jgi:hypothetical protein